MEIRTATVDDLDDIAPLFDRYRQFYEFPADEEGARRFLQARFTAGDSTILLALDGSFAVGFAQLYPSWSSGRMARVFIFNDLYVLPEARRLGAGRALLDFARDFAAAEGAVRLTLSTQAGNHAAQSLYEAAGWQRDLAFQVYNLALQ